MTALKWNDPACCMGVLNDGGSNTSPAWQGTLGAATGNLRSNEFLFGVRWEY